LLDLTELTIMLQDGIFDKNKDFKEKTHKQLVLTLAELKRIKKEMKKGKRRFYESWFLKTNLKELNKTIDIFETYVSRGKRLGGY